MDWPPFRTPYELHLVVLRAGDSAKDACMMRSRKPKQLTLERLEPRDCPALDVFYAGGNLFILGRPVSNSLVPGDGLNITATSATGAVSVTETDDSGNLVANYGTYTVRHNLYIGLTDYNTNINVDTSGNRLYANLIVNLGLGDITPLPIAVNPVSIYSSDPTNPGSIAGNVTVFNGSGIEYLSVGSNAELPPTGAGFEIDGDLNVSFPRRIDDSPGNTGDTLIVTGPASIRGDVNTTGVDNVQVGDPNTDESVTIGGNLTVNNALALNHTEAGIYGSVAGNVSVVGSNTSDVSNPNRVEIGSGNVTVQVGGNVTLDQTEGSSSTYFGAGSTIQNNLSYSGNVGTDVVTLNGAVLGDAAITVGGGDNVVSASDSASFTGNLQITAGNGNNDLSVFDPAIAGDLNLTLGNGNDTFGFGGSMTNGTLTSNTGNGNDSITLTNATGPFALNANLGAGVNTLSFDGTQLSSANIAFAPHVTPDIINQVGAVNGPFSLTNFP
jgi:hypothetical protein